MTEPDLKQTALDKQTAESALEKLIGCHAAVEMLNLADIIDVPALQSLMNDFYELTHIPMALIDMNGKVLVGVGWQQICTEFHRVNPETCRYCVESDLELTSGIDEREFKLYKCKNNMWDAAAPLIVGGRKMGNLFTGQFFFDDETPDYEMFRAQAKKYGFDETAYMAALQKVQRLSRAQFKQGMTFLHGVAKMISQTSYTNLQLAHLLEQQKQTQEALRQSEEQFHAMFERHQAIKLVIDPESGSINDANEAAARFYGYSRQQLCTMNIQQVNQLPEDEIRAERQKALTEQRNYFVFPHRLADGTIRTVEVYSTPVNIRGKKLLYSIIHDITERWKAEEALRQNQLDFSRAQAVGSIGSWRLDVRKNELTWSDESYNIFGIPKGTPLTYEIFLSCIHPDDRAYVDTKWKAGLAGADYDIEHRIISEGKVKWVREKAYLEFTGTGELVGGFGITQDITYRRQIEENLRQLNESLEQRVVQRTLEVQKQADRLRALASQLSQTEQRERKRLSKILHDHIQQLLVAAKMQLNWLKNDHDAQRRHTIIQGVDAILRETLDASRSLSVDLSPPILHEAGLVGGLSWLASRMREKNGFNVHLSADNAAEPAAEEVRFLLFECVRELLLNALKHSGVFEANVVLKRLDDNNIQVTVYDHGKGFESEKLNNRQSDDVTFGLFSIRERLTHIGGQMQVDTACGRGARFTLTVAAGSPEAISAGLSSTGQSAHNDLPIADKESQSPLCRVLVCDDHRIVREGLVRLLQLQSGIEVVGQAQDGQQAIEMAGRLSPDVIIMDVNLGRISGIEATKRILAANSSVKIIGLSMHEDGDVANAMRSAGAIAYFTKTGPSEDLIAAIKACAIN